MAVGNPQGAILSDIFMAHSEENHATAINNDLVLCRQYVDDMLIIALYSRYMDDVLITAPTAGIWMIY